MPQVSHTRSKIYYSASHPRPQPKDADELLAYVHTDSAAGVQGVCVVENISYILFQQLHGAWSIDVDIYKSHALSPEVHHLWDGHPQNSVEPSGQDYNHLDGIYEYHNINSPLQTLRDSNVNYCDRHVFQQDGYPVSSNTRITYCRPMNTMYLFLVDAPFACEQVLTASVFPLTGPTLRFPYASNFGGVLIPRIRDGNSICNLFDAFRIVFSHRWQVRLLFRPQGLFLRSPLLYLMSNSLWELEFRSLDTQMKRISFVDIRDPEMEITDSLHDLRANLAVLRTTVAETLEYVRPETTDFLRGLAPALEERRAVISRLKSLQVRADELHIFFNETVQLLASMISIRDSQLSIEQAEESLKQTKQGTFLTRLAALYLPLSVATGVFGMNLREINDAVPRWWAFLVVLVGLTSLTFALLWYGTEPRDSNATRASSSGRAARRSRRMDKLSAENV